MATPLLKLSKALTTLKCMIIACLLCVSTGSDQSFFSLKSIITYFNQGLRASVAQVFAAEPYGATNINLAEPIAVYTSTKDRHNTL